MSANPVFIARKSATADDGLSPEAIMVRDTLIRHGLETPMLADNPFIGPNPLNLIDASVPAGSVPGVTVSYGALSSTGSYLLDTGSAATFISTDTAQDLDIRYREGTYGPGLTSPILENITDGTALPGQFQVEVSGLGGTSVVAGFFVDSLLVRTVEGGPQPDDPNHLRYLHTPVFVLDITGRPRPRTRQRRYHHSGRHIRDEYADCERGASENQ